MVWSSWDDINGPVDDSTFLHDDFMILFEFCWNLAKCPNYEINSTKIFFFFLLPSMVPTWLFSKKNLRQENRFFDQPT